MLNQLADTDDILCIGCGSGFGLSGGSSFGLSGSGGLGLGGGSSLSLGGSGGRTASGQGQQHQCCQNNSKDLFHYFSLHFYPVHNCICAGNYGTYYNILL